MIIGLAGFAQTGKDTVGQILVRSHGFKRLAYADAIRKFLLAIDPFVWSDLQMGGVRLSTVVPNHRTDSKGWEGAKTMPEVRRLLQLTGSEGGREVLGEDVWVNIVTEQIKCMPEQDFVVTDCRFKNECWSISDLGGKIVRVLKDGVGPPNTHSSEMDILTWPYDDYINNNGDMVFLEREVVRILG